MLIKPLISNKSIKQNKLKNRYTFLVIPKYNKIQIKKELENLYNIKIHRINTMKYNIKNKKYFNKKQFNVKKNIIKKVIIELTKGDKINYEYYENNKKKIKN